MATAFIALVLIGLIIYVLWENRNLEVTRYSVKIPYISEDVKGLKIVQISDLHIKTKQPDFTKLIEKTKEERPDLIVMTGDLVHAGLDEFTETAITQLAGSLTSIAPTYAVTGNHDYYYAAEHKWQDALANGGANVLLDKAAWIPVKNSGIVLMGLAEKRAMEDALRPLLQHIHMSEGMKKYPKILLAHHPEYFEEYLDDRTKAPDLILSGHTHAGQIRLPFVGGIYAPGQGLFPKYDYGYFYKDTEPARRLIVSRGIGNSSFPFRVFNRPEIVTVTLD